MPGLHGSGIFLQFKILQRKNPNASIRCVRIILFWSECRVSNSGPRGPKPRALPAAPHPDKLIFTLFVMVTVNCFESRATSYRSETLSLCSLGALRIALCFFLFSHCLLPPPAAAMSESPHPDWYLWCLTILFYLSDKVNKNILWNKNFVVSFFVNSNKKDLIF